MQIYLGLKFELYSAIINHLLSAKVNIT